MTTTERKPDYPNLLILIGASAGGLPVISEIIGELPETFQAAIVVATHRNPAKSENSLAKVLESNTQLRVEEPHQGEHIDCTTIYVGHPRDAVEVEGRNLQLHGIESHWDRIHRIDELFQSAADSAGPNACGVLLSGVLRDGVNGLKAIHDAGGICIVQHPDDAQFSDMPSTALQEVPVQFVGTGTEIARHLIEIAEGRVCR